MQIDVNSVSHYEELDLNCLGFVELCPRKHTSFSVNFRAVNPDPYHIYVGALSVQVVEKLRRRKTPYLWKSPILSAYSSKFKGSTMETTPKIHRRSSPAVTTKLLAGGIAGASETMITVSHFFQPQRSYISEPTKAINEA